LPVEAIAYVHVAGGIQRDGLWHDTHAHPVSRPVLDVLAELRSRVCPPGVLLERDDAFPAPAELASELDLIRRTVQLRGPAVVGASGPAEAVASGNTGVAENTAPDNNRTGEPTVNTAAARQRLALGQTALLSALVAGTPVPEGFDSQRIRVQSRALAGKRADVVAKVAPELPEILGAGYRKAFLEYASNRPMRAGYRRDALGFAEHLLLAGREDPSVRGELTLWWQERSGPRPPRKTDRLIRAARAVLVRR
jgi:hypothetical protein